MTRFAGTFIGTGFGLAFVLANSGPPLDPTVALVLRVLASATAAAVVALAVLSSRGAAPEPGEGGPAVRFDRFYGIVLLLEVVLVFGGIQVLRAMDAPDQANIAWITLTVGLHFFPLARHWRMRALLLTAVYATVLGGAGLAMVAAGYPAWVPFVSGTLTGAGMLSGLLVSSIGERTPVRTKAGTAPGP